MTPSVHGRLFRPSLLLMLSLAFVLAPLHAEEPRTDKAPPQARAERADPPAGAEVLDTDRKRFSYMAGVDVGRDIARAGPDIDFPSFRKAVQNAFAGGAPLLDEQSSREVSMALMQRTAQRSGRPVPGLPPGSKAPPVAKDKVGLLIGADIGRSLAPAASEIDLDTFMLGVRGAVAGTPLLLDDARLEAVRGEFAAHMQARAEADAAKSATAGQAFLAENRTRRGVIATRSGLQYQVLRQGSGPRPRASDRVRVNYRGTLLDGTEFDSSYSRGAPAEFSLTQVITGWTEGLGLMPVGAKYRLWIPPDIGYGARGSGSGAVPPNATLVFDVELLEIL